MLIPLVRLAGHAKAILDLSGLRVNQAHEGVVYKARSGNSFRRWFALNQNDSLDLIPSEVLNRSPDSYDHVGS
jgi:hypothetical protein